MVRLYLCKPIAQTFTWIESLIGQFYLAIIIRQMVGRFVASKESKMQPTPM